MQKTTNGTLTEDEIIEFLINSGYEESQIKEALKQTHSSNIDTLVDYMIKMEEQQVTCKVQRVSSKPDDDQARLETLKLIEENKKRIEIERKYKEELIRRTLEDKKNREKEEKEMIKNLNGAEKEAEIKADCIINVRLPDSRCLKYNFAKEDTVNDFFKKIEEALGYATFKLFKPRNPQPIERSDTKLVDCKLLYPRAVLFVEE